MRFANVYYRIDGKNCLNGLSFRLKEAKRPTILLGANGAGKTLTLKLMQGVINPSRGFISGFTPIAQRVMVFQNPLVLKRSCRKNLLFFLRAAGMTKPTAAIKAGRALEWCGLAERSEDSAKSLSLGQQRLLALARAYALEPKALLLDEPTANLDPKAVKLVEELITDTVKKGYKVIMATQSIEQARRLGSEIIFLVKGRLGEQAKAGVFFNRPVGRRYGL